MVVITVLGYHCKRLTLLVHTSGFVDETKYRPTKDRNNFCISGGQNYRHITVF